MTVYEWLRAGDMLTFVGNPDRRYTVLPFMIGDNRKPVSYGKKPRNRIKRRKLRKLQRLARRNNRT